MPVYEGVLEKISGGKDYHGGFVHRQFIQIGDTHLRNVVLMNYHDELLQDEIGEVVALAVSNSGRPRRSGKKTVVGIRTPNHGVVRPSIVTVAFRAVLGWFVFLFTAIGVAFVLALGVAIAIFVATRLGSGSTDSLGMVDYAIIAVGAGLFLVWFPGLPLYYTVRMFQAWHAIARPPAGAGATATAV